MFISKVMNMHICTDVVWRHLLLNKILLHKGALTRLNEKLLSGPLCLNVRCGRYDILVYSIDIIT